MPQINSFEGTKPRVSDQLLSESQSSSCKNFYQTSGALVPFKKPKELLSGDVSVDGVDTALSSIKTIFDTRNDVRIYSTEQRSYLNSPTISNNNFVFYSNDESGGLHTASTLDSESDSRVFIPIPDNALIPAGARLPEKDLLVVPGTFTGFTFSGDNLYYSRGGGGIYVYNVLTGRNVYFRQTQFTTFHQATYIVTGIAVSGNKIYTCIRSNQSSQALIAVYDLTTITLERELTINFPENYSDNGYKSIGVSAGYLYFPHTSFTVSYNPESYQQLVLAYNLTTEQFDSTMDIPIVSLGRITYLTIQDSILYLSAETRTKPALTTYNVTTKEKISSKLFLPGSYAVRGDVLYRAHRGTIVEAYNLADGEETIISATNSRQSLPSTDVNYIDQHNPNTYDDVTNFVFTYISSLGFEGQPSRATPLVFYENGDTVQIDGIKVSDNERIVKIGIYAEFEGMYRHYINIDNVEGSDGDINYTISNFRNSQLGEPLYTQSFTNAPSALKGIISVPNGVIAGFEGSSVYLSEPYQPHAYPLEYVINIESGIVGLSQTNNGIIVLTDQQPYLITGATPDIMSVQGINTIQSCSNFYSILSYKGNCYYASPDGIIESGTGRVLTDTIWSKQQWLKFNPETIEMSIYEDTLLFTYSEDIENVLTSQKMMSINLSTATASEVSIDNYINVLFYDARRDTTLFSTASNKLLDFNAGEDNMVLEWETKQFVKNEGVIINAMRVDAYNYPIKITFTSGDNIFSKKVHNDSPFRVGDKWRKKTYKISVESEYEVYGIYWSNNMDNLQ